MITHICSPGKSLYPLLVQLVTGTSPGYVSQGFIDDTDIEMKSRRHHFRKTRDVTSSNEIAPNIYTNLSTALSLVCEQHVSFWISLLDRSDLMVMRSANLSCEHGCGLAKYSDNFSILP
jgi:hypothetical protein